MPGVPAALSRALTRSPARAAHRLPVCCRGTCATTRHGDARRRARRYRAQRHETPLGGVVASDGGLATLAQIQTNFRAAGYPDLTDLQQELIHHGNGAERVAAYPALDRVRHARLAGSVPAKPKKEVEVSRFGKKTKKKKKTKTEKTAEGQTAAAAASAPPAEL